MAKVQMEKTGIPAPKCSDPSIARLHRKVEKIQPKRWKDRIPVTANLMDKRTPSEVDRPEYISQKAFSPSNCPAYRALRTGQFVAEEKAAAP
jgi:hypothetical protein